VLLIKIRGRNESNSEHLQLQSTGPKITKKRDDVMNVAALILLTEMPKEQINRV
jgi:hypothetical protein